jgi:succinate dehydrogenase/fumarate reductase cytochrome b subunit (b558 family)
VSEAASPSSSALAKSRRAFLLRKLHSLSGVVPVGMFLLFHLWTNATALQGQERYDDAVAGISHMPFVGVIEVFGIFLPLAFHALYGVKIAIEGKPNLGAYPLSRNWMYVLQRVTGVVAFLFIGFHLYEYWFQKAVGKMAPSDFYPALCANLSSTVGGVPAVALVYILGIAAAVFHFTNGLWGFCFSWGITVSKRAQRWSATAFGIAGIVLFLIGANTAIYFATGSRLAFSGHLFGSVGQSAARTCAEITVR